MQRVVVMHPAFRKVLSIVILLLIALPLAGVSGVTFIYVIGYFIGGEDFIAQLMEAGQASKYDGFILFGMVLASSVGGIIGIHLWKQLMKSMGFDD